MLIDSLDALCLDTFDPSPVASFLSISHSACPTPCINHGVVRLFFWIVLRLFWSWLALLYHKIFDISWHIWLIPSFMIFKSHYFRRPSNCTILHRQLTTTTFLNLFDSLRQTLRLELRGGLHLELLWVWQVVLLPEPRLRPRILTLASKTCSADQCSFVSCSMTMNDAWYAVQLRRTPLQSVLHHGFPLANVRVPTGCCCRCRCCRRLVHRFKLWHCHTDIGGFCFGLPGCLVRSCKHQFLMFLRCPGIGAAAGVAAVLNRAGSWNWSNHVKKCQAELRLSVSLQVQIVRQDQYGQWPPPPVALYSDLRSKSQQFQVALLDLSRCLSLWTDRPWHQIPSCAIRTWTLRPCNISPTCCGMISYWFMMIYDAYGYWYLLIAADGSRCILEVLGAGTSCSRARTCQGPKSIWRLLGAIHWLRRLYNSGSQWERDAWHGAWHGQIRNALRLQMRFRKLHHLPELTLRPKLPQVQETPTRIWIHVDCYMMLYDPSYDSAWFCYIVLLLYSILICALPLIELLLSPPMSHFRALWAPPLCGSSALTMVHSVHSLKSEFSKHIECLWKFWALNMFILTCKTTPDATGPEVQEVTPPSSLLSKHE